MSVLDVSVLLVSFFVVSLAIEDPANVPVTEAVDEFKPAKATAAIAKKANFFIM